jgi:hypothetical protein
VDIGTHLAHATAAKIPEASFPGLKLVDPHSFPGRGAGVTELLETITIGLPGSTEITSGLYVDEQGYLLTGELADEGANTAPERLITGFHQRIGDETPIITETGRFSPESLSAVLVEWITELAVKRLDHPEQESERLARSGQSSRPGPAGITHTVLTHPASWGRHHQELLYEALRDNDITAVRLIAHPIAAAHGLFPVPPPRAFLGVWEPDPTGSTFSLLVSHHREWKILASEKIAAADSVEALVQSGVEGLRELTHRAGIDPERMLGTLFCGSWTRFDSLFDTVLAYFPGRKLIHETPELTAALGASMIGVLDQQHGVGMVAADHKAVEQTVALPRISSVEAGVDPTVAHGAATERPERPPVVVTPFEPARRRSFSSNAKFWGKKNKKIAVMALAPFLSLGMVISFPGQLTHSGADQIRASQAASDHTFSRQGGHHL